MIKKVVKFSTKTLLTLSIICFGVIIFLLFFSLRNKDISLNPANMPAKIVFNNKVYVPALCIQPSSAKITKIGISNEGINIYASKIPGNIPDEQQGILVKRGDGYYQCYMLFPRDQIPQN